MIRIGLRNLLARKTRTALTALAIVLGVGMVAAALTIGNTLRQGVDALSTATYKSTDAVVAGRQAFKGGTSTDWLIKRPTVPAATLDQVRALPQVQRAVGDIVDQNTRVIGHDGKPLGTGPYFGIGQDPQAGSLSPLRLQSGRFARGGNEVVVDAATAADQHLRLGSTVTIVTDHAADYRVVGVARFGAVQSIGSATVVAFSLDTAQRVLHRVGRYDDVLVDARPGVTPAQLRTALNAALPADVRAQDAADNDRYQLSGLDDFVNILKVALLVFGFISVLVGGFTIANALSITVAQRSRELGLMRLVGASRPQVLRSVLVEALALGALASVAGAGVGYGLARGLLSLMDSAGMGLPTGDTVLTAGTVVAALAVGIVVTTLAALRPALRATRVAPIAVLRDAAAAAPGRLGRGVRRVVGVLGAPARLLGGTSGDLARRNAMRQPGRTLSTAVALTIGVALVTLVTVVGSGLKDSTTSSLDRRIAADHVIVADDGWSGVDRSVATDAAGAAGLHRISSITQDAGKAFGGVEVVNGIDPQTIGSLMRFDWKQGDDGVPGALGTDGAIVDEGWATEHGLRVGSGFDLQSAKGVVEHFTVRGIEKSPVLDMLSLGPITIGSGAYAKAFDNDSPVLTLVATSDVAALRAALASHPDVKVQTTAAWIDSKAQNLDSMMAVFYVLLALAVIVSLFGIVNTLVLTTFERTRELGMLRVVGMTPRQMRRMVRHESIITALLGALFGIAVGLGLAVIVTSVFASAGLTFVIPAGALLTFVIVAVVAGVLAAVLPARRAARLSPIAALAHA